MEVPTSLLIAIFAAVIAASIVAAFFAIPAAWGKIGEREAELAAAKPVAVAVPYKGKWYLAVLASVPGEITRIYAGSGGVVVQYNGSARLPCVLTPAGGRYQAVLVLDERPSAVELRLGSASAVLPVAGYAYYNSTNFTSNLTSQNLTSQGVYVLAAPSNISISAHWQLYLKSRLYPADMLVYAYDGGIWPLRTSGNPGRYAVWGMSGWPGLYYPFVVGRIAMTKYDQLTGYWNTKDIYYPIFNAPRRLNVPATYIVPANITVPQWSNYNATPLLPPFYCNFTLWRAGFWKIEFSKFNITATCFYNTGLSLGTTACGWTPARLFINITIKPYDNTYVVVNASLRGTIVGMYDPTSRGCSTQAFYDFWTLVTNTVYLVYYHPPLLLVYQTEYLPWAKYITSPLNASYIVDTYNRGTLNKCINC